MKTSNYILIAVFTLVVVSILTFFITSKQHEDDRGILRNDNFSEIPLPNINVIVSKCPHTSIHSGEQNKLVIVKQEKPEEVYHVGNDTLYVNAYAYNFINITCSQSVSIIIPKDIKVSIDKCELNRIAIENTGGYVDLRHNTLDTLQIQAIDAAAIHLYDNHVKFVSANLKNMGDFYLDKNEFDEMDIKGLKN